MGEPEDPAGQIVASIAEASLELLADAAAHFRETPAAWEISGVARVAAINCDEAMAHLGRLILILHDLASEPGAPDTRRALRKLHSEVRRAFETSQQRGIA
ncbi:hypothetical protein GCM10007886_26710 [Methylobacterium gregans]|nr:hypothetical protein GCM10007886_26710 [Methylobacterium gregans]